MNKAKPLIVIINGPNLNLLGIRQTDIYGSESFEEYLPKLRAKYKQFEISYLQTNHEGAIIDALHNYGFNAKVIVLNAAGYTHTSVSIRDAISSITTPVIEVHISDIKKREDFRKVSLLEDVCKKSIIGQGLEGYDIALQAYL